MLDSRSAATFSGRRCYVDAGSLLCFQGEVAIFMLDGCYVVREGLLH